jgi:hypothetical protein
MNSRESSDDTIARFNHSRSKTALLTVLSGLAAAVSVVFALRLVPAEDAIDAFSLWVLWAFGWAGTPFFGLTTLMWAARLFARDPAVEVSRAGIRDARVSPDLVPWADIRTAEVVRVSTQYMLELRLRPEAERRLRLTLPARLYTPLNKWLGYPGFYITMLGLEGSLNDLTDAVERAWPSDPPTTA